MVSRQRAFEAANNSAIGESVISQVINDFGLPAGAITFFGILLFLAKVAEREASEAALKTVSNLLINGSVTSFGELVARLVPTIFDKVFGSKPLSWKLISRSFRAYPFDTQEHQIWCRRLVPSLTRCSPGFRRCIFFAAMNRCAARHRSGNRPPADPQQ